MKKFEKELSVCLSVSEISVPWAAYAAKNKWFDLDKILSDCKETAFSCLEMKQQIKDTIQEIVKSNYKNEDQQSEPILKDEIKIILKELLCINDD